MENNIAEQATRNASIRAKTSAYLKNYKLTQERLAEEIGISKGTLNVFLRGAETKKLYVDLIEDFLEERAQKVTLAESKRGDIGWAMDVIKRGGKIKRSRWDKKFVSMLPLQIEGKPGHVLFLALQQEDRYPYAYNPITQDLLATDWEEVVD